MAQLAVMLFSAQRVPPLSPQRQAQKVERGGQSLCKEGVKRGGLSLVGMLIDQIDGGLHTVDSHKGADSWPT